MIPVAVRKCVPSLLLALSCLGVAPAGAAVSVIANRTEQAVELTVVVDGQPPRAISLAAGESRPVTASTSLKAGLATDGPQGLQTIDPNCAYAVTMRKADGRIRFAQVPLGGAPGRAWPVLDRGAIGRADAGVIRVKLLVDDDERRNQQTAERELRQRIEVASKVLQAYAGITLEIVAFQRWDSNNNITDFNQSLSEFEQEVFPGPAQVAIGFSSQYQIFNGRVHFGGTRGALHSHILLRERAQNVLETERQELLVHELGHFLGAMHSTETTSVMRPVIGDGRLRRADAKLGFDPPNALLLAMMGQEIRSHEVRELKDVSPDSRRRMAEIYAALAPMMPEDTSAGNYLRRLNAAEVGPLVEETGGVLEQLSASARMQASLRGNVESVLTETSEAPLEGDALMESYVRQAALAAKRLDPGHGPTAFVIAMGFALDDTGTLQKLPVASALAPHLEGEAQRRERLAALGEPTMRGRPDLAKHFFVSATLVPLVGSGPARSAGLVKELLDSNGGSGFSFRDMAANRAGIVFAHAVLSGSLSLEEVASSFTVNAFLPPVDDLRESLQSAEFIQDFGGAGDARVEEELSRIEARIMALPVYQSGGVATPTP